MNWFAQGVLILWLPVVLCFFATWPPRRAVIVSFVVAWLFLPIIGFSLPGIPDYTKMSATTFGVILSILVFEINRLLALRPRLIDIPMIGWCVCPFFSSISSNIGAYEGLSASLDHVVSWGFPYLIGRVFLDDYEGIRQLAIGIVIGGLVYIPLCLIEIRLSPILERMVYGAMRWEGTRYGGYRPKVFMVSGLELGMWMANATLICFWLWFSGAVKTIWGYSSGWWTLVLVAITILCKSTGAGVLMFVGMTSLWLVGKTKKTWPVWLLILIPPLYEGTRTSGIWSGQQAVDFSDSVFGGDRSESLGFRIMNENMLIVRALERPLLGWGRFGGFQQMDALGRAVQILDGYWIITLGYFGIIGLTFLTAEWILPLILLIRRQPGPNWSGPEVGAAAVLSVVLALYMIDNLSNAMPNPVYALALGGLVALPSSRRGDDAKRVGSVMAIAAQLIEEGRPVEAEPHWRRAISLAATRPDVQGQSVLAEALEGLGRSLMAVGDIAEAESAFRDALSVRESLAAGVPDADRTGDLAIARENLARTLSEVGKSVEAIEQRRIALGTWDALAAVNRVGPDDQDRRVVALNDLAWLLATDPDPTLRDPASALALAEEAVRASGGQGASLNTLGVARYRAGDWLGAVEVLERSAASVDGGTAFDYFFLCMACRQLGDEYRAQTWFDQAVAWSGRHRPGHAGLARFRDEAATLLAMPGRSGANIGGT